MAKHMLTTTDNPFNPVTQYEQWYEYDAMLGHHTPGYLARIVKTSDELSQADQDLAIEQAMDDIIRLHADGFYKKIPVSSAPQG